MDKTYYISFHIGYSCNLTLFFRSALAPAVSSDCVVVTSPLSAAKKRAGQPVVCGGGGGGNLSVNKDYCRFSYTSVSQT